MMGRCLRRQARRGPLSACLKCQQGRSYISFDEGRILRQSTACRSTLAQPSSASLRHPIQSISSALGPPRIKTPPRVHPLNLLVAVTQPDKIAGPGRDRTTTGTLLTASPGLLIATRLTSPLPARKRLETQPVIGGRAGLLVACFDGLRKSWVVV